jgi:TIGR03009 family protein
VDQARYKRDEVKLLLFGGEQMRRAGFVFTSLLSAAPVLLGQQAQPPLQPIGGFGAPPAAQTQTKPAGAVQPAGGLQPAGNPGTLPVAAPQPAAVDAETMKHLEGWEAAMKNVSTFYASATKTVSEPALKRESKVSAELYLLKPKMARLDICKQMPDGQKATRDDVVTMYLSNGQTIYEYDLLGKKRTSVALGPNGAGNNLLLDIMSGMSAKQITERFTVQTALVDKNYVVLHVKPVFKTDQEEFELLKLALCGPQYKERAYIPRQVILIRQSGRAPGEAGPSETWDFPEPMVNPKGISEKTFDLIPLPKGWIDEKKELPRTIPATLPTSGSGK